MGTGRLVLRRRRKSKKKKVNHYFATSYQATKRRFDSDHWRPSPQGGQYPRHWGQLRRNQQSVRISNKPSVCYLSSDYSI